MEADRHLATEMVVTDYAVVDGPDAAVDRSRRAQMHKVQPRGEDANRNSTGRKVLTVDLAAEVAKAASRWVLTANSARALVQD